MKKMTVAEIMTAVEKYELDYSYIGIRTQDCTFTLGPINHCSKVWDNGIETEDELDGISVSSIKSERAVRMHSSEYTLEDGYYFGDHVAIIGGNLAQYGEDVGEMILSDAEVLEVLA